jgi:hypothetical protein
MARFFNELNCEVANVMELQQYVELEDIIHMTMKVEKQLTGGGEHDHHSF